LIFGKGVPQRRLGVGDEDWFLFSRVFFLGE